MKIIKFVSLLVLMTMHFSARAAVPDWNVNSHDYLYSMTLTGPINIDGIELADPNVLLAAFVGTECRGLVSLSYSADRYFAFLTIYSNTNGEEIELKAYIPSGDEIVVLANDLNFQINGTIGTLTHPFILSQPLLSSEALITSMSFPEQDGVTIFKDDSILIPVSYGTNRLALIANFSSPVATKVYVNDQLQISGSTVQDYTSTVTFDVLSPDETNWASYKVKVSQANAIPTDITLSMDIIEENLAPNSIIGTLTTADIDLDSHTYSLVSGTDDEDNGLFYIQDMAIYSSISFNYEAKDVYKIRLRSDDGNGGIIEKAFLINVSNANDAPSVPNQSFNIDENSPITTVLGTISASDPDEGQLLKYTIIGGDPDSLLLLDSITGILTVNDSESLDYDIVPFLDLDLVVHDNGIPVMTDTCNIHITVNNVLSRPSDITISNDNVDENLPESTIVGTLSTENAEFEPLFYTLISGLGSDDNELFYIEDNILYTNVTFDFETQELYSIRLLSDDGDNGTIEKIIHISVNNTNDAPSIENQTLNVNENSPQDTPIGTIIASDPDNGQSHTYKIIEGNTEAILEMDSLSGTIYVNTSELLDYETVAYFDLHVVVFDNGSPVMTDTCLITIEVNDIIEGSIECSNYISPNNDGINDFWIIQEEALYVDCLFYIFDMHGNIVMEQTGYQNDWGGTYRDKELPEGSYYYVIKDEVNNYTFKGTITLVR